jgi:periplasmic protein TonB
MNNLLAMDRSEKIGLGAALAGHALLLALLIFAMVKAAPPAGSDGGGGEGIAVSIVSDGGAVGVAEPAPGEMSAAPQPLPVEETVIEEEVEVIPTPVPKTSVTPKPATKVAVNTPKPAKKTPTPKNSKSDFDRRMEGMFGSGSGCSKAEKKAGKCGGGGSSGGSSSGGSSSGGSSSGGSSSGGSGGGASTPGQVSVAIANEVRPFIPGCAPETSDNSSLNVFVQLSINKTANLIDARVYDVKGITPGNQAQVERMKSCVLSSLRAASPYNLDPANYDRWKNHKVQLKVNFK